MSNRCQKIIYQTILLSRCTQSELYYTIVNMLSLIRFICCCWDILLTKWENSFFIPSWSFFCVCVWRSSFPVVVVRQSWQSVCVSCPHRSAQEQLQLSKDQGGVWPRHRYWSCDPVFTWAFPLRFQGAIIGILFEFRYYFKVCSLWFSAGVAVMHLQSPPVNSLSLDFLTELSISVEKLEMDKSCRGLIITSVP